MSKIEIGELSLTWRGHTIEDILHIFHFDVVTAADKNLYLHIDSANGYYQSEGYHEVEPYCVTGNLKMPIRMFGDTWEQDTITLVVSVNEFIPNPNYDRELDEYYKDPDMPPPPEKIYKKLTSKSVRFRLK